jgi:Pentapeptide repeats (8 copies)
MSRARVGFVFGLPLVVILVGLVLWWPPSPEPDRNSDLGASIVGGGIVAFVVLYLDQVLSRRQEKNLLRLQLSTGTQFEGVDLSNQDLSGFYLPSKNFSYANLEGADLRGATLSSSTFNGTRLKGADLRGANLQPLPDAFGQAWIGSTDLPGVLFDSKTRWPEGLENDERWPVGVDPRDRGAINLDEQGWRLRTRQWFRDTASAIFG